MISAGRELVDYVLVVRQGEPHHKSYASTRYFIQEFPSTAGDGWREFLILKDDDDEPDVYECVFGPNGVYASCGCTAGRCGKVCKHLDALRSACFEVGIPEPRRAT